MKAAAIIPLAMLFSLGSAVALPTEDSIVAIDEQDIDVDDIDFSSLLESRTIPTKFTYLNFPKSGKCATTSYTTAAIKTAGDQGGKLEARGKTLGKNKYPHVYGNKEKLKFDSKCKTKKGSLYEFPILNNGQLYSGKEAAKDPVSPGTDRVVLNVSTKNKNTGNVDITFCGLMTHTGAAKKNDFVACSWS